MGSFDNCIHAMQRLNTSVEKEDGWKHLLWNSFGENVTLLCIPCAIWGRLRSYSNNCGFRRRWYLHHRQELHSATAATRILVLPCQSEVRTACNLKLVPVKNLLPTFQKLRLRIIAMATSSSLNYYQIRPEKLKKINCIKRVIHY